MYIYIDYESFLCLNYSITIERILDIVVQSVFHQDLDRNQQNIVRSAVAITKTRPCNKLQFFTAVKTLICKMKTCDVFLIFAQNIDCGYTLEPPQ